MSGEEILTIFVKIETAVPITGNHQDVQMIVFSGHAKSRYFEGEILSPGVDLQRIDKDGTARLSARYILSGTDCEGQACRLYIENNGASGAGKKLRTKPEIVTDSDALSWLETAELVGEIEGGEELVIHIRRDS